MAAVLEVEKILALEIFLVCLAVALLSKFKRTASKIFAENFAKVNSQDVSILENEIIVLKREIEAQTDMLKRVTLWTQKAEKENNLKKLDNLRKFKMLSLENRCFLALTILLEGLRVAFILLNRYTPVAKLQPEVFWPLDGILSYPTGIPGALGAPVWGVACYVTIATILTIFIK